MAPNTRSKAAPQEQSRRRGGVSASTVKRTVLSRNSKVQLDITEIDEVYDSTLNDEAIKRFCTLNLAVPMSCREDKKNTCPSHIFKATAAKKERDEKVEQEIGDSSGGVLRPEYKQVSSTNHVRMYSDQIQQPWDGRNRPWGRYKPASSTVT
eukprot:scaffold2010_cov46-Cyclotella_meneghiniana.AAC.4